MAKSLFLTSAPVAKAGVLLLALFTFFCISGCRSGEKDPAQILREKHAPWDQFLFQRSWPDPTFPHETYIQQLREAEANRKLKTGGVAPNLTWQMEGPANIGGRFNKITVNPGSPNVLYAGCASGGVYKTIDTGQSWFPVFDEHPYLAIGEITLDPQNPNRVYVGTGDPNISGYPFMGDGVYKSDDGGTNWIHLGLSEASIVSRIIVHPTDSLTIYAATMGLPFVRNIHRGLYKSTDGGNTWSKILYINNESGIADLVMDPSNPNILYAAGWTRIRNNTESVGYGTGAKIYKTTNGGTTWTLLGGGLPTTPQSRIGLAISASNPSVLYASYVGTNYELLNIFKTTNAGATWSGLGVTGDVQYNTAGFGWYFGQIRVSPTNPNEVYLLGVDLYKSPDGGVTWAMAGDGWWDYTFHADKHDLIYAPGNQLYCATDGGLYRSSDSGVTWQDCENIPSAQFYRVAVDPHNPGFYGGGAQDNGTIYGSADSLLSWIRLYGGDGFQVLFHPTNPDLMYAETQNGGLLYQNANGWAYFGNGILSSDRRSWDMPLRMSKINSSRMFTGTYRVYKNFDAPTGSWTAISPDLTNGVASSFHVITVVEECPLDSSVLYAGTSDALVWKSTNGGTSWQNITAGLPGRYVTDIQASPSNSQLVYVSNSGYKDNEFIPHIHRSDNQGSTWTDISGDLPQLAVNHLLILPGYSDQVILAATDGGVFVTLDAGTTWERIGDNMPVVPVYDIAWDPNSNRVIAGTFGRSMYSVSLDSLFITTGSPMQGVPEPSLRAGLSENALWVNNPDGGSLSIELFDVNGRFVKSLHTASSGRLDLGDLKNGPYIARLKSRGHVIQGLKFVKI